MDSGTTEQPLTTLIQEKKKNIKTKTKLVPCKHSSFIKKICAYMDFFIEKMPHETQAW